MKPRLVVRIDTASHSTMKFGKRLCVEAQAGQSTGVAAVVFGPRGKFYLEVAGAAHRDPVRAGGAVNILRRTLEQMTDEEEES